MTNPTWVGSTVIDPDDTWSLSWTVTTADLPAGTQSGDLLLLWLIADAASGSSTFAPTGGWGLSGDWTLVRNQRSGGTTQGYVGCFRSTYVSGALPQTLVPKSSTGTTIDRSSAPVANWYGILMAYRPSSTFSADGGYSSALAATTVYGGSGATEVFPDGVAGGTTVGVAATTVNASGPTLSTTADFAVRASADGYSWRNAQFAALGYIEDPTLGNSIWVAGQGDSKINSVDPVTLTPTNGYTNTLFPQAFTFDHQTSPGIWFSEGSASSSAVTKIDLTTKAITTSVTVGNAPRAMCYGDDSIWVGHINDSTIKRIDPVTETVTATITLSPSTRRAGWESIYADGSAWFSDYSSGRVFKIDPLTNTSTETYLGTDLIYGFGYDGTELWLTSSRTDAIYTLDPSTNVVTKRTANNFFATLTNGHFAWDGSYMWMADGTDVIKVDPATWTKAATVSAGASNVSDIVYLDGYVFAGCAGNSLLVKIDVATDTVVDTFDMGLAKVRGGYSHIDREFVSAYSGTKPQWTKTTTSYGAAVFAAFGPGVVPTADQWGVDQVRW